MNDAERVAAAYLNNLTHHAENHLYNLNSEPAPFMVRMDFDMWLEGFRSGLRVSGTKVETDRAFGLVTVALKRYF